jgi:hypothetical protein
VEPLANEGGTVTIQFGAQQQTLRFVFHVILQRLDQLPTPPAKPFCLASIRNEITVELFGEMGSVTKPEQPPRPFMAQMMLRLPFGWDCIEVFPFLDVAHWNPDNAESWAERDILAEVVSRKVRQEQLRDLDPNIAARRHYAALLSQFRELLDRNPEREEELQTFLAAHPELLCPAHTAVWPKLPIGKHKTDFVFREASSDYLLVEIERSTLRLFKSDGHQTAELTHAHGQIRDWKRYIEDKLSTVQKELGLTGISANPRSLIVMGRSSSLNAEDRRTLTTIENDSPKLKIMTYDDVFDTARAVVENLLGPLWNISGNTVVIFPKTLPPLDTFSQ